MLNMLNVAQTGLKTSQIQVENVSNNLANENVDGYKRRVVDISELDHSDSRLTGRGVSVDGVSRITDDYMYQNLIQEDSKLSSLNVLDNTLDQVESIFYETDETGLSADLNRYFTSLENLKASPYSEVYKNDLDSNANALVSNLQSMYSDLESLEKTTQQNAEDNVEQVNSILKNIGDLNDQILQTSDQASTNALLDQRDQQELELARYVDVDIQKEPVYEIKIGGVTAVSYNTYVKQFDLVEDYQPQQDIYVKQNSDGSTKIPYESSLIDVDGWDSNDQQPEKQTIELSGEATEQVSFLGSLVANSTAGDSASDTATNIENDKTNIIDNWNTFHPDREIEDITANGDEVTITYKDTEGDVAAIDNTDSNGIVYTGSVEDQKGIADSFTYTLNNDISLTVTRGEVIVDDFGVAVDLNGDGDNTNDTVTKDNALNAMVYKINKSQDIGGDIIAYNGMYEVAENGEKILTNDPRHSQYDPADPNKDRYIVIEAHTPGEEGRYVGEFTVNDSNNRTRVEADENISNKGIDNIHLEVFDQEVQLTGGALKSQIDNIQTDSGNNYIQDYKEKLDQFAKQLSDLTDSYIEDINQNYTYGTDAVELSADEDKKNTINMFSGADVKSLKFNSSSLNNLKQEDLDYLATLQWKEDIDFDGTGENKQSFTEHYRSLRFDVADDRENVILREDSQAAVSESMHSSYDKLTKVDKDDEMIELMKFQNAYEANAKIITVVDEMLQTLLNM